MLNHNLVVDTERKKTAETGCGPDIKKFDISEQVKKELESIDRATIEVADIVKDLCKERV